MDSRRLIIAAGLIGVLGACGDDDDGSNTGSNDTSTGTKDSGSQTPDASDEETTPDSGDEEGDASPTKSEYFALGTTTYSTEGSNAYLKIFDSIERDGEALKVDNTWEQYMGYADVWAQFGSVFVSPGASKEIVKYSVNAAGDLVKGDTLSFIETGVDSSAFYYVSWVSPTKAYLAKNAESMIPFNPTTMEYGEEFPLDIESRQGLVTRITFADRGGVTLDGKVYKTAYWTDETYSVRADDSVILVVDSDTDEVTDRISVDCPALDHATLDDDGNIWFSPWTGGAGVYYVLDQAPTCIAKFNPTTKDVEVIQFADIADGHQGAALKYAGNGKFVMSIFDEMLADAENATDANKVVAGLVWRLWSYDPETGESAPIEGVDLNSGAVNSYTIDGEFYSLVPGADYLTTNVYRLDGVESAELVFSVSGWSYRLFSVR